MLACGSEYQPGEIRREIESFHSSTSPVRVATDVGDGFLKSVGNPMGSAALVCELVAAELAAWIGLRVPPFAVVPHCSIEIIMARNGRAMLPPMFFSLAVEGTPRDGGDTFLSRLNKPDDLALLVVFDTWIRNWDRYDGSVSNSENLLFVRSETGRKYELTPIDHSGCLVGDDGEFPTDTVPEEWVFDPQVYGEFPEFQPYLSAKAVGKAVRKLATLPRDFVVEVVNSVPAEWGLGQNATTILIELICRRAT